MPEYRGRHGLRDWPLAAKVIAALTVTLLPLGVAAMLVAVENYRTAAVHVMSPMQLLAISAPLLMWLGALTMGWLVASALIVRPLTRMRATVDRYTAGDASVRLRGQRFLSREVGGLAAAFDAMADAIALHDAETSEALAEQQRLTREVHHRVKNNLQIVSSLLSLQAREAANPGVAHAYALVQSRVAALAVVHRWMYEASAGRDAGIDLRALVSDLCAGLEHGLAASERLVVKLHCDIAPVFVVQDTAVPLAFLITELANCAARSTTPAPLMASITIAATGNGAILSIAAPCFADEDRLPASGVHSVGRIIHGMARQLRSPLRHDAVAGRYDIDFRTVAATA